MTRFVSLLRGINVGGRNIIKMADLSRCFEALGLREVRTYIQSGNVIFESDAADPQVLCARIEAALRRTFAYEASVVLRSRSELEAVVQEAPIGFGGAPRERRYDVLFLKDPLTSAAALADVPAREGVDEVRAGPSVLYFSRLISEASRSRLTRISSTPIYQRMTIRNWNTTTRLLALMS